MSETKESGIYWLGKVASDWDLVPAWKVMGERKERSQPEDDHLTPSQTYGVVTQQKYMEITGNKVVLNLAGADSMKRVCSGDFIIHLRSFQGGIEASTVGGKVSNAYTVLTPQPGAHFGYYRWFMKSVPLIEGLASSTDQLRDGQSINFSRFSRLTFPLPPLETQQRIADYLDRETAEIDAAGTDLDKYVELLEKRKLSRLESALHDVIYRMCPVGLIANVTLGKMVSTRPPKSGGVERQYLRAAHVQPGGRIDFTVTEKKMWFSEKELERLDLRAGDVVVVEGGAGFGRSAYLEYDLEGWGFQNSINRVRVDPSKADSRFVQLMLNRALLNGSIGISADTATLPHFTAEKLARFRIPICDIQNQKAFSQEIYEDQLATDSLIAESTKLRDLLLKRRSVLITEVVTGRKQV